jgi:AraC family transcriptional activator of tynA and feaB
MKGKFSRYGHPPLFNGSAGEHHRSKPGGNKPRLRPLATIPCTPVDDLCRSRTAADMQEVIKSPSLPEHRTVQGFEPWRDFVRENFPWLEMKDHSQGPFRAQVAAYRQGSKALTTIRSSATEVTRTMKLADVADEGFIKFFWPLAGTMQIAQDERNALVTAGEATIFDTARPYRIRLSDDAHFAVLMLPYNACPGWQRISPRLCGAPLADNATAQAALGALLALLRPSANLDYETADNVLSAVTQMLSVSLHRAARPVTDSRRRTQRIELAHRHVLEHIDDPTLDVAELAAALHMSRRTLYSMFRSYDLTPGGFIDDIRMERCRQALADPAQEERSIAAIAFENGFRDATSFSRWFKTRTGQSPSDYRRRK